MFNKSPSSILSRNDPLVRKDVFRQIPGGAVEIASEPAATPEQAADVTPEPTALVSENNTGSRLIVGPEVKLKGAEILDCDTLVVEGSVEATMDSRVIRIAEAGRFSGKVGIDIAEIHGHFDGELTARSQLIIHATGKVTGKIRYGKLVIDEGGELCGEINALSAEKAKEASHSTRAAPGAVSTVKLSEAMTG